MSPRRRRYVCGRCGEAWDSNPVQTVPCPHCGAPAGQPCKRPSGHALIELETSGHKAREQAALDAGKLSRCPGHRREP